MKKFPYRLLFTYYRLLLFFCCSAIFVTSAFALDISSADADSWKFKSKNGKTKLIAKGINTVQPMSNYFAAGYSVCLKAGGSVADTNDLRTLEPKTKKNGKVTKWFYKKKKDAKITYIPKKNLLKCQIWKEYPSNTVLFVDDVGQIPAGAFSMGDHYGAGDANELPVHQVYISTFNMDKYEVSNEKMRHVMQWAFDNNKISANLTVVSNIFGDQQALLNLGGDSQISFSNGTFFVDIGKENFPCVFVSWYGACAYCNYKSEKEGLNPCYNLNDWTCNWSANGHRLPTEAEWEKAARGGLVTNYFPWASLGGHFTNHIDGSKANYYGSGDPYDEGTSPCGYYDGNQIPAGVDMANGYGLYDMAGNVSEWCWDWYELNWYSQPGATNADTKGPAPAFARIIRGGNWNDCGYGNLRCANRADYSPFKTRYSWGFRCVRSMP